MEKEKKIMVITISIMALILVCVIFMQFKVVNERRYEKKKSDYSNGDGSDGFMYIV